MYYALAEAQVEREPLTDGRVVLVFNPQYKKPAHVEPDWDNVTVKSYQDMMAEWGLFRNKGDDGGSQVAWGAIVPEYGAPQDGCYVLVYEEDDQWSQDLLAPRREYE